MSRESEFVVLKERRLVTISPVYNGLLRFSFLMESCPPGSVPDAHLLASVLDLVSKMHSFYLQITNLSFSASFRSSFTRRRPPRMRLLRPLLQQRPMARLDETELPDFPTQRATADDKPSFGGSTGEHDTPSGPAAHNATHRR